MIYARPPEGTSMSDTNIEGPIVLAPGVACARLGVTHRTLRRWIEKGLVAVQWTAGGQVRVPVSEIERIKTGKGRTPAPKEKRLTREDIARAQARGAEIARIMREYRRIEQSGAPIEQQKLEKARVRAEERLRRR
jgi:excisionase family DNA binding protein